MESYEIEFQPSVRKDFRKLSIVLSKFSSASSFNIPIFLLDGLAIYLAILGGQISVR
jgi:hypothetical protein